MLKFRCLAQFGSRLAVFMLKSFNAVLSEEGVLEKTPKYSAQDASALLEVPSAAHFHVRVCADIVSGRRIWLGIASLDGLTELRQGWLSVDRSRVWRSLYHENCFMDLYF